jgi:DHA2 family multidrug resistance protein-like MFS transporter
MSGSGSARWWALVALDLAVIVVGLDASVLNVALPTLARDLNATTSDLQWFVSGYSLVMAAALLPAGLLGDLYGRKRALLCGLLLVGAGSIACALAPSAAAFTAARLLLGLGAAFIIPLAISALTVMFDPDERPRAIGIWGIANFFAMPLGPIVGGWILSHAWWGWIFLMNVPVVATSLLAVLFLVPESRGGRRRSLDLPGIVAASAGLAVLTDGLIEAGRSGWGDAGALGLIAGGILALCLFGLWEWRQGRNPNAQPILEADLFRSPGFTSGAVLGGCAFFALVGVTFVMPQFFQGVLGMDPLGSGLRVLPMTFGMMLAVGIVGRRLLARAGARLIGAAGFVLMAAALVLGAQTSLRSGDLYLAGWMAINGLGLGLVMVASMGAAVSALSADRAGVGSAAVQAIQKVAIPLAIAVLGSVLNAVYQDSLRLGGLPAATADLVRGSFFAGLSVAQQVGSPALLESVRASFLTGMGTTLLVAAGVAALSGAISLVWLPGGQQRRSELGPADQGGLAPDGESVA